MSGATGKHALNKVQASCSLFGTSAEQILRSSGATQICGGSHRSSSIASIVGGAASSDYTSTPARKQSAKGSPESECTQSTTILQPRTLCAPFSSCILLQQASVAHSAVYMSCTKEAHSASLAVFNIHWSVSSADPFCMVCSMKLWA